jgi:serine phosphatase RsbU (regulator of sigma subunit)
MIADVMGKGVPAALFSTTMRGLLRGLAARSHDPAQLLSGLNRLLHAELSSVDMFITAQIVHVDLGTRQVTAASAGHCPPLFVSSLISAVTALPTRGLPLGVLPDTIYYQECATLGNPVTLLLHTDGLTDTRNEAGKRFGQRRLMAWLQANSHAGHSASTLRDQLATELNRFRGDAVMADDQAFLLLTEESLDLIATAAAAAQQPRRQHDAFLLPATT